MIGKNYQYFLTIAETGSITKAAKLNFVSQPSMTQYLNRLESSLGVTLFDRKQTPFTLTPAGEIYRDFIENYIRLEHELEAQLNLIRGSLQGTVQVGIPMQMQPILVPRFITPFLEQNHDIDTDIKLDAPSPSIERQVAAHILDCALIYLGDTRNSHLTYYMIEKEPIYLICSRRHPILRGRSTTKEAPLHVRMNDLKDETFCLVDKGFVMRQIPDNFLKSHRFKPRRILTMSSMNAVIDTVRLGNEIAFLPNYVIERYNYPEELGYLSVNAEQLFMDLSLVYPNDVPTAPAARAFINFVESRVAEERSTM